MQRIPVTHIDFWQQINSHKDKPRINADTRIPFSCKNNTEQYKHNTSDAMGKSVFLIAYGGNDPVKKESAASEYRKKDTKHKPAAACHFACRQIYHPQVQGKKYTDLPNDPKNKILIFSAYVSCQSQPQNDQREKHTIIYQRKIQPCHKKRHTDSCCSTGAQGDMELISGVPPKQYVPCAE